MTKICPKCSTENMDNAGFCQSCGADLKNVVSSAKPTETSSGGTGGFWNKQSKGGKIAIGVGVCCIGLILIIAIFGIFAPDATTTTTTNTSSDNSTAQPDTTAQSTQPAAATTQPIKLSGTGQEATQNFDWPGGLMRVSMTHKGSSNFAIWLMDSSTGQQQELLVNEIGSYSGSRAFDVPAGTYMLDVTADGPWTVTITQ